MLIQLQNIKLQKLLRKLNYQKIFTILILEKKTKDLKFGEKLIKN